MYNIGTVKEIGETKMYFFKARTSNRNYYIKNRKAVHNRDIMAKLINLKYGDIVYVNGFKPISIIEYIIGRIITK